MVVLWGKVAEPMVLRGLPKRIRTLSALEPFSVEGNKGNQPLTDTWMSQRKPRCTNKNPREVPKPFKNYIDGIT